MKKMIFLLAFVTAGIAQLNAQSLFKTVYDNAIAVVNNSDSSDERIQIHQFEVTVLNYMQTQVQKRDLKKDDYFFDSQAVNLKSFVDDFLFYLNKARMTAPAKRADVINCYREASLKNPLFNDLDKERTMCYVNDTKTYTPFSLDTDWEKAYDQASSQIRSILR